MKTLKYYGTPNFNEFPLTGEIITWNTGEEQVVSDRRAELLLALEVFSNESEKFSPLSDSQIANGATGSAGLKDNGDLVLKNGNALSVEGFNSGNVSAKVLDSYLAASLYTVTGNDGGATTTPDAQNASGSQVLITTASGTTTSVRSAKETPVAYNPDDLGTMVFAMDVTGKNSSKFLQIGSETVSLSDNATTPLYGRGLHYIAVHASRFPTFYADKTPRVFTPNLGCGLSGNDGVTTIQPGKIWYGVQAKSIFVDTFDDINDTILTVALPYYQATGRKMTIFVPTAQVGDANKLTWANLTYLESLGHAICCNSTTDDSGMSTDVATALANANLGRQTLLDRGFNPYNANFLCYATNAKTPAVVNALQAAGFKSGRTTDAGPFFSAFGIGGQQMWVPSYSLQSSRTEGNIKTQYDLAVLQSSDQFTHTHRILTSGATGSNINLSIWEYGFNYQTQLIDSGSAISMTYPEWFDYVSKNRAPLY